MELIKVVGKWKILIIYEGMACKTDLILTSRPAFDGHLPLQELIFGQTRSLIKANVALRFQHIIEGKPRYFPVPITT